MAGLQKTWSGDLTWSIAKQIGSRVNQSANMAADERAYASAMAEAGDTSLEEAGIGRGYFFRRALGSRFGGDAVARTRGRFEKTPPKRRDPLGTVGSRFRAGFDYNASSRMLGGPLAASFGGGFGGGGSSSPSGEGGGSSPSDGGGGINPEVVPNDTILGKMINVTPGGIRNTTGGIKVHDEKLGKFVSEVGQSLSGTMNVLNTDNDAIKEGMFSAQEGLTVTQDQLENVGDTLEDKLDAIINEIRTQNDLIRRSEDQKEASLAETQTEQRDIPLALGSGTDRVAGVNEDVRAVLRENQAEDAAAYDNDLSPMLPEKERGGTNTILHGKEQDLLTGKVFDGPDTGYPANTSGNIAPINNFFTRGQTGAASKTGGLPSGMGPVKGKVQDIADIPEVKAEMEKLGKAVLVPVKAAGAMTLGRLGMALSRIPIIGPVAGAIKQIASPIASMFGIKDSIITNLAQDVGDKEGEQQRQEDTASHSQKSKNEKNWFSRSVDWIKNVFSNNRNAEKGAIIKSNVNLSSVRPTSNISSNISSNVSMSAEKGTGIKNSDTQIAWEPGDPWPSRHGPLDGPQGPAPGIPWVPEAPKAKRKSKETTTQIAGRRTGSGPNVPSSAEKGSTIINGPKTGYNVNVGGTKINAHGKELVTPVKEGVQITPLDNFATDGIRGNEVTPGGDLNLSSKYTAEKGGVIPTRSQQNSKSAAAINAPQSNRTAIINLNSKEREFARMLTRISKVEPIVINSKNAKSTPPPQEMNHIMNVGDPGLDVIYPSLV